MLCGSESGCHVSPSVFGKKSARVRAMPEVSATASTSGLIRSICLTTKGIRVVHSMQALLQTLYVIIEITGEVAADSGGEASGVIRATLDERGPGREPFTARTWNQTWRWRPSLEIVTDVPRTVLVGLRTLRTRAAELETKTWYFVALRAFGQEILTLA